MQDLALDALQAASIQGLVIDLADARIVRGVLAGCRSTAATLQQVVAALSNKDAADGRGAGAGFPGDTRRSLHCLMGLYGDESVLEEARRNCRSAR